MRTEETQSTYVERLMKKRAEGGFTLIELLIVIIILAILAAIVVFAVGTTGKNASAASCESDAKTVETALETYKASVPGDAYPPAADGWTYLDTPQVVSGKTYGPFMRSQPGTTHYEINWTTTGSVSADPTSDVAGYVAADDIDTAAGGVTTACANNAT